jgi:hypothetical protein
MNLFVDPSKEIAGELASVDVDKLTPVQAFDLVRKWKEKLK